MKKNIAIFALLLTSVTSALADDKHGWYADAKKPGTVDLWLGDKLVGTMDPFDGNWNWAGRNKVDMRKWTWENNPPKQTGELPKASAEPESERDKMKRELVEKRLEEAGIDPAKNASPSPKPSAPKAGIDETSDKTDCKCDECKCKDGRKGDDCVCEGCKCAVVGENKRDNAPKVLFGVVRSLFGSPQEKWSVSGTESNRAEAFKAIGAGASDIPNDAGINRLTVIGTVAARSKVMADLESAPSLAYWRDKFVVKEYLPTHWRIESGGFEKPRDADKAVVYVQSPDGKVLFLAREWVGPDPFAKELRDKVPGYDSSKDPSFKSQSSTGDGLLGYWRIAALAGAIGFVGYQWRKK